MKRVALYVRVSHDEQVKHGLSVDSQIDALQIYARDNGYKIVDIYNDAGISARKDYRKRPALLRMIKDCQDGKIDLILMTKLDRFFRSVQDYYAVMSQIGNKVKWRTIWEDYETETSTGIFKVNIMLSVAQSEADRTSERIKSVMDYKRSLGEVCSGGVATGYKIENKRWVIDEETAPAVRAFYDTYLSTFSRKKAIDSAKENGLRVSAIMARRFLYDRAYYGDQPYIAEAYLTTDQHNIILKAKPQITKQKKYEYIFSGTCRCGLCGKALVGSRTIHKNKSGSETHSVFYTCSGATGGYGCAGTSISEKYLEQYLLDNFSYYLNQYNISVVSQTDSATDTNKSIANDKAKLKRIMDLYELGDLSFAEYKEKRLLLLEDIARLESTPASQLKDLPSNWADVYSQLDIAHKRAFWKQAIDYIEVTSRKCKTPIIHF